MPGDKYYGYSRKKCRGEVSGWKTLFFTTDHQCNLKKKSNCVVFMVKSCHEPITYVIYIYIQCLSNPYITFSGTALNLKLQKHIAITWFFLKAENKLL